MELLDLGNEQFVSLATFRRSGVPVATPVWIARDGDALVLFTPAGTGKLKRLAHTPRVRLTPCSRRGQVAPGAPTVEGHAVIVRDPAEVIRIGTLLATKYGWQFRLFMAIEKLVRRAEPERVGIRITG